VEEESRRNEKKSKTRTPTGEKAHRKGGAVKGGRLGKRPESGRPQETTKRGSSKKASCENTKIRPGSKEKRKNKK